VIYVYDLLILIMFDYSLGKWFGNNGDKYEGEWENSKKHGKGMKEGIYFMIY